MHEENSTKTTQDPGDELTADSGRASDASPAGTHRALSLVPLATLVAVVGTAVRIAVLNVIAAVNDQELWDRLTSWDSKYYLEIARVGYFDADIHTDGPVYETTMAFFPGFPMLLRVLGWTGISLEVAALIVNTLLTVAMAAGVMALAQRLGAGRRGQCAAAIVVSSAPMSIVFSMPYTEALFGALVVWGLVALDDRAWWRAAAYGFALSFVRLTSVDFLAVFALWVLIYGRRSWQAWLSLIVAALPLPAYLFWTQRYLAEAGGYFGIQTKHWHSTFDWGSATVRFVWEVLTEKNDVGYLLSVLVILGVPVLLVAAWGRLNPVAWWFSAALCANVLLSDGIMHSRPRLLLPAIILALPWAVRAAEALRPRELWLACSAWVLWSAWFSAYMLVVFEWAI
ncbi:mannosyltransferase family protein [Corynebacterium hesseae]|uniref:Mannosyltransferase family protein n=1 Tax=Corynebacterium hesseae TaxID=2913502 RepID=A0ABU9UKC4_9CORY|nr:hypothetical protein CYJ44_09800 [Corynebacterium aurimucosum]